MELELSETQNLIRGTARDYAQRVVAPLAARIDAEGEVPPRIFEGLAELGLMGVNIPEEFGGSEAGTVAYSLALTEVAAACASTAVTMAVNNMVGEVMTRFGSEPQRRRYVPDLCSGARLGAFALSEVEAGSDAGSLRTTATRDGDGWVLNGTKQWISHADTAGLLIVWARTGDAGPKGLSCFLVEGEAEGLVISGHEDKMGLRGSHTCSFVLDKVRVGADAILGAEGQGFKVAMMALDGGRIGIGSQALGIGRSAFEAALAYSKERKQFGKPLSDFQAMQWMIADGKKDLDAARLLTLRAAWLKDAGKPFTREASMAKLYSSEMVWRICNNAVQIHGGYGYSREFPVERHLRDARVTQIYEGTSEVQRLVIARAALQ